MNVKKKISIIGAGTIGTALGNILSENGCGEVLLLSVEEKVVSSINEEHINARYFPGYHLRHELRATTDVSQLKDSSVIFLAIPSVVLLDYLKSLGIGCQVGYRDNAKKRDNTLIVRGIRSGDREKIPATFQNFKVKVE